MSKKARAYIIEGVGVTRAGPIRNADDKERLENDKAVLMKHAMAYNVPEAYVATEGPIMDLPTDSAYEASFGGKEAREEQEMREDIYRQQQETTRRQHEARRQRERERRERERRERERRRRERARRERLERERRDTIDRIGRDLRDQSDNDRDRDNDRENRRDEWSRTA